jgi:predicted component of type VI protein secretion system
LFVSSLQRKPSALWYDGKQSSCPQQTHTIAGADDHHLSTTRHNPHWSLQRMAYARLDVYWDDGRLDSYLLTTDTVSVGRAPSNTIPLDTDTISRYHFSIVRDEDIVTLTDLDSANGTYIDGIQLVSNQPHVLAGVEEIQIGQLRIIYNMLDDQPTLPMAPLDDSTQRIAPPSADFRLELDATSLDVWPASSSNAELSSPTPATMT